MTAITAVPVLWTVILCALSFWAGQKIQNAYDVGAAIEVTSARRLVQASEVAEVVVVKAPAPISEVDPLDPSQLEPYLIKQSGLMQLRPPLPAAPSGDDFYHVIPFQILSWYPRIVVYPGFVDKPRCEHVMELAKKNLYPSGLAYKPGEHQKGEQETRTSSGTFLSGGSDTSGVLKWIEERIAAATQIPSSHGEAFNVLRYEHMQHYDSHYDYFDPKDFGPQPSQRIATVLVYLSEVLEGGETVFKREGKDNGERNIYDWRNCTDGSLKYKPRQGDAVLFWSAHPDGSVDHHALHGGCPVVAGQKWVATKWIRSKGRDDY
jgi:prolyl 4-hydroxylase